MTKVLRLWSSKRSPQSYSQASGGATGRFDIADNLYCPFQSANEFVRLAGRHEEGNGFDTFCDQHGRSRRVNFLQNRKATHFEFTC